MQWFHNEIQQLPSSLELWESKSRLRRVKSSIDVVGSTLHGQGEEMLVPIKDNDGGETAVFKSLTRSKSLA